MKNNNQDATKKKTIDDEYRSELRKSVYNQSFTDEVTFLNTINTIKKRLGDMDVIRFLNMFRSRDYELIFTPVPENVLPISYPIYKVLDSILEGLGSKNEVFFTETINVLWKFYWELKRTISEREDYLTDYHIASLLELFNSIYENNLRDHITGIKDKFESFVEKNRDIVAYCYYELRGTEHWGDKIYFLDDSDLFKQELLKRLKKYNFSIDFDLDEKKINRDQLKEIIILNLKNQEFKDIFPNLKRLFKYEKAFFYDFKLSLGDFLEYIIDVKEAEEVRQIPLRYINVSMEYDNLGSNTNIIFNDERHVINLIAHLEGGFTSSNYESFPESICNLLELQNLDLSSNKLNAISNSIDKLTKLEQLNLSKNKITAIPKSLCNLTWLKQLDMSKNEINYIPESIKKLKNIITLYLSNNNLTYLPKEFGDLVNLKHIELNKNKFSIFPESLCNLEVIESIDLSDNQLKTLPDSVGKISSLKVLWLKNCGIEKIPDSIGNLSSLKELNLSNHKLDYFPSSIINLQLEYININSIHISDEKSQELFLSLKPLREKGTKVICEVKGIPKLKASDLPYKNIEDDY